MTDAAAQSIALSLGLSALTTVVCRRIRIPALLPLLLVGLALGTSGLKLVDASALGPALKGFITAAIGLLIFEGALHLNRDELARAPRAVWGLVTIGAVVTWACAAAAAHLLLGMSLPLSILLGASLIVTGPTVVQPILKLVRVSPRLHTALAAEAVLIDPIGVVATITTLEVLRLYIENGSQSGLASAGIWIFAKPLFGGAGIGAVMGFAGYWLLRAVGASSKPEPQMLNLLAVGICMTCVGAGEAVTPEGGLAAVTICGVIMARGKVLGARELRAFKELLAFMLVGTLFVLLASRFDVSRLSTLSWRECAFVLALIFLVRPIAVFASTWRSKLTAGERIFAATFAPRGIVAMSVVAVASAELVRTLESAASQGPSGKSSLLAEAGRLDLIMFVVIVGSVLLASTLSPAMAWILRVRAGAGNAVLLVGAHPLSLAFAKELAGCGLHVRIVDNNETRVADAVAGRMDAALGDATDPRWMDDVGAPHDIGWLIAWTGNHDVDQLAARWAEDRLGRGHAAIWSAKPARGHLESADISGGESVLDWLHRLEDGRVLFAQSQSRNELQRVIGWVNAGRFVLNVPASKALGAPQGVVFIGLQTMAMRTQASSLPIAEAFNTPDATTTSPAPKRAPFQKAAE